MIEICKEYGDEVNSRYSKIYFEYIAKEYENFYTIEEEPYNHSEIVVIDYRKYEVNKINEIVYKTDIDNDIKIKAIKEIGRASCRERV